MDYDFCGWATKNDLKCADGRIIRKNAFRVNDGKKVPLVWNHQHNSVQDVLGHALLENREEGVYAYCKFNKTQGGQDAKEAVRNGDVTALSIWANNLEQIGPEVHHGAIREVSLVLAGANPGAYVESVMVHGEPMGEDETEGIFYTNEGIVLADGDIVHAEPESVEKKRVKDTPSKSESDDEGGDETVAEVFDTLTPKQKKAVAIVVGQAIEDARGGSDNNDEEEDDEVKHNIFESAGLLAGEPFISHDDMKQLLADGKRLGSLKAAVMENMEDGGILCHAIPTDGMVLPSSATVNQTYGIRDMDMLFPDYRSLNTPPEMISRNMDWVQKVMSQVHHTPFSRIKSMFADITEDEARAKGYIKGKQKKDEVFSVLKRTTSPQTIYKRQKIDRDDMIDITDFDVIAWIKAEMKVMFNEEKARAILIGDGRPADSEDKINETNIRPVIKDVALFNTVIKVPYAAADTALDTATKLIDEVIRGKKKYKGSGRPTFWTTEDYLTDMLLITDKIGHKLYKTETELTTTLRVAEIVPVEVMEGQTLEISGKKYPLIGTMVNLNDYNVGADRGGADEMFEDFDIDFNQMKYLIECRMSGALVKPFSAVTFVLDKEVTSGDDDEEAAG